MRRMDVVMLTLLNAQERTEAEFRALFEAAGEGFVFKVSLAFLVLLLLLLLGLVVGRWADFLCDGRVSRGPRGVG